MGRMLQTRNMLHDTKKSGEEEEEEKVLRTTPALLIAQFVQ